MLYTQGIYLMSGLIRWLGFMSASTVRLLDDVVLIEVCEENLTSHRCGVGKGRPLSILWKGLRDPQEVWGHSFRGSLGTPEGADPRGALGRWGRLFPPFLLPYKVQGKGDIRLAKQGQGGGGRARHQGRQPATHNEPSSCRPAALHPERPVGGCGG